MVGCIFANAVVDVGVVFVVENIVFDECVFGSFDHSNGIFLAHGRSLCDGVCMSVIRLHSNKAIGL